MPRCPRLLLRPGRRSAILPGESTFAAGKVDSRLFETRLRQEKRERVRVRARSEE